MTTYTSRPVSHKHRWPQFLDWITSPFRLLHTSPLSSTGPIAPLNRIQTKILTDHPLSFPERRRSWLLSTTTDTFWDRINRQVFALVNGQRSSEDIAALIRRPQGATRQETLQIVHTSLQLLQCGGYLVLDRLNPRHQLTAQLPFIARTWTIVTETPEQTLRFLRLLYTRIILPEAHGLLEGIDQKEAAVLNEQLLTIFCSRQQFLSEGQVMAQRVIGGLTQGDPSLMRFLIREGRACARRELNIQHYSLLSEAVISALQEQVPRSYWVPEVEYAWRCMLTMVSEVMVMTQR